MSTAKEEAFKAIEHVRSMLLNGTALGPLERRLAVATLEHASEQVEAIQEVKRVRRTAAKEPLL